MNLRGPATASPSTQRGRAEGVVQYHRAAREDAHLGRATPDGERISRVSGDHRRGRLPRLHDAADRRSRDRRAGDDPRAQRRPQGTLPPIGDPVTVRWAAEHSYIVSVEGESSVSDRESVAEASDMVPK